MTVAHTGKGLEISTMHNGYLVRRYYQGYTQREAVALFTAPLRKQQ